jgi:hypothetical protein
MFEQLESLRKDLPLMFERLVPIPYETVMTWQQELPTCPQSYWQFLLERGSGELGPPQQLAPFRFFKGLCDAETEYYFDKDIYEHGAVGQIKLFGCESTGIAYGFDIGDHWKLVEVDNYRLVEKRTLTFGQFIDGLIVCYPQIPVHYRDGIWSDSMDIHYVADVAYHSS